MRGTTAFAVLYRLPTATFWGVDMECSEARIGRLPNDRRWGRSLAGVDAVVECNMFSSLPSGPALCRPKSLLFCVRRACARTFFYSPRLPLPTFLALFHYESR